MVDPFPQITQLRNDGGFSDPKQSGADSTLHRIPSTFGETCKINVKTDLLEASKAEDWTRVCLFLFVLIHCPRVATSELHSFIIP